MSLYRNNKKAKEEAYEFFKNKAENDGEENSEERKIKAEKAKDYSLRYNIFIFATANCTIAYFIAMTNSLLNQFVFKIDKVFYITDVLFKDYFVLLLLLVILAFYIAFRIYRCPHCGGFMRVDRYARNLTYHCCNRCGEHVYDPPAFSGKVLGILALVSTVFAVLTAVFWKDNSFRVMVIAFLDVAIIAFVNTLVYLFVSVLKPAWDNLIA